MKKKFASIGLLAGTAVGGGVGLMLQATGPAGAASAPIVAPIDTTGTDTDNGGTTGTRAGRLADVLAPLVEDGTLTQAQADAVIEALQASRPEGGRGDREPRGGRGGRGGRDGRDLGVVSETIGITAEELRTGIQAGQTIAELAAANGSSAQAVIDALVGVAQTHLDEHVAAGEMTADEAAEKLVDITERITTFVNETPEFDGRGPGGRGPGGDSDAADEATS
jgi:polyhydroxyalkanoate synthesis regulator phasin